MWHVGALIKGIYYYYDSNIVLRMCKGHRHKMPNCKVVAGPILKVFLFDHSIASLASPDHV
jgi:hypothetical protein